MRLIDADEVKRFYKTKFKDLDNGVHWSRNDILMNLDCIETVDIAPVIRCKDCKHTYLSDNFGITAPWLMCKRHIGNTYKVNEDDYCSWAERKEK